MTVGRAGLFAAGALAVVPAARDRVVAGVSGTLDVGVVERAEGVLCHTGQAAPQRHAFGSGGHDLVGGDIVAEPEQQRHLQPEARLFGFRRLGEHLVRTAPFQIRPIIVPLGRELMVSGLPVARRPFPHPMTLCRGVQEGTTRPGPTRQDLPSPERNCGERYLYFGGKIPSS
jgi:hypothetical protein